LAGPRTLLPTPRRGARREVFTRLEPALEGADVVMMLRIQQERLGAALLPTLREYARTFGLSRARLGLAKPNAIVMHPGPMNRGVEINDDVADGERSVITAQVESGVAVRMAVLYLCATEPGQPIGSV
jgi:aspartate carbamoyltransferase catalytic subunit